MQLKHHCPHHHFPIVLLLFKILMIVFTIVDNWFIFHHFLDESITIFETLILKSVAIIGFNDFFIAMFIIFVALIFVVIVVFFGTMIGFSFSVIISMDVGKIEI